MTSTLSPPSSSRITLLPVLKALLALACIYRFIYPFYQNPAQITYSDMGRHLYNGLHLFDPGFWGSIDAKFYQVWLYIVFNLGGATNHAIIALFTGLISAGMPLLWYKAARELFPREKALGFALFVALCPSFFFIYAVFMPETVMLPMLGLCLWMTLRTLRKQEIISRRFPLRQGFGGQAVHGTTASGVFTSRRSVHGTTASGTFGAFFITAWCWVLAAHIKLSVAGMAGIALLVLLYQQKRKLPAAAVIIVALLATCVPAALHSHKNLNVYEPFHFAMPNTIYRMNGHTGFTFQAKNYGSWIFISPSFTQNAYAPFGRYTSWRTPGPYHFVVDPENGIEDWERILAKMREGYTFPVRVRDWAENALFFALSPSWPDAWENAPFNWQLINFHARWMWPPIILLVLLLSPFAMRGASEAKKMTLILTWATLLALLFQQSVVTEGRYRKPVEPFMLLCILIMAEDKRARAKNGRDYDLEDFLKQ